MKWGHKWLGRGHKWQRRGHKWENGNVISGPLNIRSGTKSFKCSVRWDVTIEIRGPTGRFISKENVPQGAQGPTGVHRKAVTRVLHPTDGVCLKKGALFLDVICERLRPLTHPIHDAIRMSADGSRYFRSFRRPRPHRDASARGRDRNRAFQSIRIEEKCTREMNAEESGNEEALFVHEESWPWVTDAGYLPWGSLVQIILETLFFFAKRHICVSKDSIQKKSYRIHMRFLKHKNRIRFL